MKKRYYFYIGIILIVPLVFLIFLFPRNNEMEYHYKATYSFTNDAIGSFPRSFSGAQFGGIQVVEEKELHSNVVEIDGTRYREFANHISGRETGTIEFWILKTNYRGKFSIILASGRDIDYDHEDDIMIKFEGLHLSVWDNGLYQTLQMYSVNSWIHFKLEFDINDKFYLWVNNNSMDLGNGFEYYKKPKQFNSLWFTIFEDSGKVYIDAIGYSWDKNYNIGDNFNLE